ncbi:hypothetical protein [Alkalibacillus haloalkaliphilus]|uniref:hypothetical protein n=1 Tax=Alkalibacillus haloalkaliphilus TaxID=94136 RepID=UPI002935EFC9|nr:hypothetical protein [Alkalibacillus haloalkaliphilus]MDV2581556.1 hypothetical protein [Alkalibacillus haloalkaliphilus]
MKEALYYPNFYIDDEKWLKFALLYLDEIVTITPNEASINYTSMHEVVLRETNLFSSHSPLESEIEEAAFNLGEFISRASMNPMYDNNQRQWRNRSMDDWEIYNGKMSYKLQEMLLDKEWAKKSVNGLNINPELASQYMTLLANIIAGNRNIPTITDKKMPVNFLSMNRNVNKEINRDNRVMTLSNEVEIFLPRNIEEISIEEIIEFRNNPENSRNLTELHNAIENMNNLTENRFSENEMLNLKKNLYDAKKQYKSRLAGQFTVGAGSVLGIYQLISGDAPYLDFIREVLGLGVITGVSCAYGNLNGYRTTNKAIGYLSDIENLTKRSRRSRYLYQNR